MLKELFHVPFLGLPIHTYGVLVVIGFLLALQVAYLQAKRLGRYADEVMDFAFWALVGGVLGARILYIVVEARDYFYEHPWVEVQQLGIHIPRLFALWEGGLVYWGGAIGGFVALLVYAQRHRISIPVFADLIVLGLPLGQAFGRLGCVAAGCCYGKPVYHLDAGKVVSDLPFALRFPPDSLAYPSLFQSGTWEQKQLMLKLGSTLPLFPSQLAESFGCLLLFFILLWIAPRKWFHGQLLLCYAIGYSVMRFLLETLRGDAARGFVSGILSTSQFISLSVVFLCIVAIFWIRKMNRVEEGGV